MKNASKNTKNKPRRSTIWARLTFIVLVILVLLIGIRLFFMTSFAARLAENQINKQSFDQIEAIEVSGISGDLLSRFNIANIKIRDQDGIWAEAKNAGIRWHPLSIIRGPITVSNLQIDELILDRKPLLNPKTETDSKNGKGFLLETFKLNRIQLNESFIGEQALLTANGQFHTENNGSLNSRIDIKRTDVSGDRLNAELTRDEHGLLNGQFEVFGSSGGAFVKLLNAPNDRDLKGDGSLKGTLQEGSGELEITFGEQLAARTSLNWLNEIGKYEGELKLENWPVFNDWRHRIGDILNIDGEFGTKPGTPFTANIRTPEVKLIAKGERPETGLIPEFLDIALNADNAFKLAKLPDDFKSGTGVAKGRLTLSPVIKFDGTVGVNNVETSIVTADSLSGPAELTLAAENDIHYKVSFEANAFAPVQSYPVTFSTPTKIRAVGTYFNTKGVLDVSSFNLTSSGNKIEGRGRILTREKGMELTGNADLEMLEFGALPSGSVAAKFQLEQSATTALKISSNGRYRPNAQLMAPLDEILGQSIIYDVNLKPVSGGIDILHADISGDKLQTTLSGRYSDNINIDGEADISAPYSYQTVKLNDTAQISYTIMGTTQNPTLKIDAKSSQVQVGGNVLNNPHFRAEFDQIRDNLEGPLQLDASTKFGDLLATTNVTRNESGLGFKNLNVRLDQLLASGFLAIAPDNLATGKMIINLAEGQKQKEQLSISLTPQDGKQGLELSVDTRNVAYKNIGFDAIRIQASGTLDRLSGRFEVDGRHGDKVTSPKFALALPFQLNRSSFGDITASGTPVGQYGNIKITGSEPVVLSLDSGRPNLKAALDVSDGKIEVDYSGLVDHDTLKIIIGNLPVSTLRLPGSLGDTKGRISALVNLNTKAPHPSGTANFSLTDWRGFEVEKGQGLTTRLDLVLNESAINWQLDGQAINGFKINGNGNFPVVVGSQLNSLRPNMLNPISGQLAASGPAASIFGLITPSDDELLGNLNANLTISGTTTEPRLIGQANGKDIGFEFPELGTRIRNANFDAAFSNDGLQINSLTASDSNSGRMSANGKFTFGEFGRPLGELNLQATNFKALDRRDVDAWLDGNLIFQNGVTDSLLSGNIDIRKAELRQFVTGTASVVEIEVEEINRPKEQAGLLLEKPVSRVALDVKVKAPRNIFIRSRGIDVEMAVDADVNGTLTDPEFVGTATIIRGGYKIAGKNLAFENGTIEFDGPLSQAKMNLKAETETQNLKAGVDISGTMENPKIDLSSTPERPEDEILSALLFGRSVSELSIIESAQLAGALAQFSGVGSGFDLLGGVRNAFGFNQLNIDYKPNGGTQVSGGRYLAKNVYLQLFSGAGLDQSGAIIDWEIRKNIALRSRIQADYNQSLSLKWKKDF